MIMANTFREALTAGKPTIGTHFLFADPDIPELIGDLGLFDYAEFAAEYSVLDAKLLYHMARAGQCAHLPLMIKLDQEGQGFWAQMALGAGFKSVLFTDIRTPADIAEAYRVIRADQPGASGAMGVKIRRPALSSYAPDGYLDDLASVVFVIMLEKNDAVENIDAVLAEARAKGVDMVQWGPADYGLSLGDPKIMFTDAIRSVEELVITKCIEHGVAPRIEITQPEEARRYTDLGVRHFCIGWDRFILQAGLRSAGEGMRKILETL